MTPKNEFGKRLKEAFSNATNGIIGSKIGVAENTVGFYVRGRIPDAEVLIKISDVTGRSIDWLLTGNEKPERARQADDPLINKEALERVVRRIVREEIGINRSDEIGPFKKAEVMLARSLGKVDGGEEEEKIRKTG